MLILTIAVAILGIRWIEPDQKAKTADSEITNVEAFEEVKVMFEQNATDGDVEVVFEAKGGDSGLATFKIVSPDGRTVVDLAAPDKSTLGIRFFRLESPEPPEYDVVMKAYPEGTYQFMGTTADGTQYKAEASLSHTLPDTVSFINFVNESKNVPMENLQFNWTPVEGVSKYLVKLKDEETEDVVTAILPNTVTSFDAPSNFLQGGKLYQIAVATVTEAGNISFLENKFTTAEK